MTMPAGKYIVHPFCALYDAHSTTLILGSLPSVKSREQNFFYGHPQNRFWPLLARLFDEPVPQTIPEKRELCLKHRIALWDTISSCEIAGSADSTIRNVTPTDLAPILKEAPITRIFCNGRTSGKYFHKFHEPVLKKSAVTLPSTSPANAAFSMEQLLAAWSVIREETAASG